MCAPSASGMLLHLSRKKPISFGVHLNLTPSMIHAHVCCFPPTQKNAQINSLDQYIKEFDPYTSTDREDGLFVWQVFRSTSRPERRYFPRVAWEACENKEVAQIHEHASKLGAALIWHFRQCLIKNWCTGEIRNKYFHEPGSAEVALEYLSGCDDEISVPSTDAGYFSLSDYFLVSLLCLPYAD